MTQLSQTTIDRINREAEEKYSNKDIGYWRDEFKLNMIRQAAFISGATAEAQRDAEVIEALEKIKEMVNDTAEEDDIDFGQILFDIGNISEQALENYRG